jgi:ribosomal protein S18 acetylase RimI-like enzyme
MIRPGIPADIPAVPELWRLADAEPTHTDDAGSLALLIDHDPAALLFVEDDGRIIGSVIVGWDGWRGSIYRLVVAPSHRRAGLGRQLLAAAEARLREVGAVRAHAIVVESDAQATKFWSSSGWEQQAERLRFVNG